MKDTKQQFEHVIAICRDLFAKKLHDYGAAWRIMRCGNAQQHSDEAE